MQEKNFLNHIEELSQKVYESTSDTIDSSYAVDKDIVIDLLNTAYATEMICTLRYKANYYKASEMGAKNAADEFLEHSKQEYEHAEMLLERIHQLGKIPQMSPDYIAKKSHVKYKECDTLDEMIEENRKAEQVAIATYRRIIQFIENKDPTTRNILQQLLVCGL